MTYAAPNATNMTDVFIYANTVTHGWFWQLILIAIFVVSFGVLIGRNDASRSFAASSFLTSIIALFMSLMNLIPSMIALITIILSFVSIGLLLFRK